MVFSPAGCLESGEQHDGESKTAAEEDGYNPSYDEENQASFMQIILVNKLFLTLSFSAENRGGSLF